MDIGGFDIGFGDILKGALVGSQILGTLDSNSAAEDTNNQNLAFSREKLAEEKRQFDLSFALKQAQGAGGGGGGGGGAALAQIAAQKQIQKSNLLAAAYENKSKLALAGRQGEAAELNNLLQSIQNVLLTRAQGQQLNR